ncbi:unnamed protein product [Aspergillus oryzae RIB40]|uniref:DNA, SC038 n=1 Tax=Aspergillus oryzae (strain ATCC 42149 / RIB 40) TaxID=510516 RepID=Q2U3E5_ASPOR|nr:unnamed protein product [Aspergillus oryzae RIB40]BAE63920.1 unnamed protein product [Aspergillus oryzae RIB40]
MSVRLVGLKWGVRRSKENAKILPTLKSPDIRSKDNAKILPILTALDKISLEAYRRSVLAFCRTKYRDSDPVYEDENLSVRPRVSRHQAQAEEIDKYQHDLETKDNPTGFGVFYDRS